MKRPVNFETIDAIDFELLGNSFYTDLDNFLYQTDRKPFFFPQSYKRPYHFEEIDNANVLERTETLNAINDLKSEITEVKESKLTTDNQTEVVNIHDYILYKDFLKKYVSSNGRVNYAEIKKNETELNDLVMLFKSNFIDKSWTKNEQLSYWINTYNLFTIQLIIQNYPTTSITKISSNNCDEVQLLIQEHP